MSTVATISKLHGLLSFERRTLTEIATALSVVAIAGSTLYNLGFFAPIEWSLISVLSVQDLLIGASTALLPMGIAMWLAGLLAKFIGSGAQRPRRTLVISLAILAAGTIAAWYFMYGPRPWTTGHLASAYLALGALAAIFNMRIKARFAAEAWLAFSLFYIPFCVGVGDSLGTMNGSATTATIVTDRANIPGRILRVTSAYIMVFNGKSISVLPLSKVLRIDRLFDASPERDYLAPFGVDDPAQN
jgi:hypothetical protein